MKMGQMVVLLAAFAMVAMTGCAGLDLRVDTIPASNDYGNVVSRTEAGRCCYFMPGSKLDSSRFSSLANYIVQEEPQVLKPHSANEMIKYTCSKAKAKGADALVVDDVGTTSVAGGYARTSPVIKARGIRFIGALPVDCGGQGAKFEQ